MTQCFECLHMRTHSKPWGIRGGIEDIYAPSRVVSRAMRRTSKQSELGFCKLDLKESAVALTGCWYNVWHSTCCYLWRVLWANRKKNRHHESSMVFFSDVERFNWSAGLFCYFSFWCILITVNGCDIQLLLFIMTCLAPGATVIIILHMFYYHFSSFSR